MQTVTKALKALSGAADKFSEALDQKAVLTGSLAPLILTLEKILWRDPDRKRANRQDDDRLHVLSTRGPAW